MEKVKIGLIGTGGIAQASHIPGYLSIPEQCEIVWACDIDEEVLEKVATKYNIPNTTTDYNEVFADPAVDAVSIMTPNAVHKEPTIAALKAGKHVLCEKPLALNAAECREMCRAAKESGKILQVGLQMRFTGPGRFMGDYIKNGHMGDIYYARAEAVRRRGVPAWGVFIEKDKQGGGPLIDIGVHILDFTLFLMGYPKPVSASGRTWDELGKDPELFNYWGDYDRKKFTVEDMAVGFIRFENGAVVVLESSFMSNIEQEVMRTQLFGTKSGASITPYATNDGITIYTEQDRQLFNLSPANVPEVASSHTAEIHAFVEAVREGKPSPVPGENGLILNAIFDALYQSSVSGKEEKIDLTF